MFKAWKKKRAEKKAAEEKIANDEYLTRLRNSARGFCKCGHSGNGPFLKLHEIESLIQAEMARKTKAIKANQQRG